MIIEMALLFCFHFASTWMLVGLIWVIQVLSYPQFLRVGEAEFAKYHFDHCWRVGLIIAPLLGAEAVSGVWLLCQGHREWSFLISAAFMPVIWLSTAIVQAPMHVALMKGFDARIIRRLIRSNWLRTAVWTARGLLLGYLVAT